MAEKKRLIPKGTLNNGIIIGGVIVLIIALLSLAAPLLTDFDPEMVDMTQKLLAPSDEHPFGTDNFGRDLFSRVLYGGRVSFKVGLLTVISTIILGLTLGMLAGYFRWADTVIMRVADGLMAFPVILLSLAIMAILGASQMNVIIALTVVYVPSMTRVVRGAIISIKKMDYIEAARASGASDLRIMLLYILPNVMSPVIVQATMTFAYAVLAEAGLSFLGMGTPPPAPSWGNILSESRSIMSVAPWMATCPGIAITLTVLGLNLLGDGLRDKFDPKLKT